MRRSVWLKTLSTLAISAATYANAQSGSATVEGATASPSTNNQIQEVVITSQKRQENVQDVPLSIVAVSGAQLEKAGVTNVTQLAQIVPSFKINTTQQAAAVTLLVRGFGSASNTAIDPDVAAYIDGVYIPRPGAILTSFLDLQSVEVLRGPQGTLSGRNATVGAIEITTNDPSFRGGMSGQGSVDVSSYDTFRGQLIANIPVSDTFALRAALESDTSRGWDDNKFDHQNYAASTSSEARLSAKWAITPSVTWIGRFDAAKTTGDGVNPNDLDVESAPAGLLGAFTSKVFNAGGTLALTGKASFNSNQFFDNSGLNDKQNGVSSDLTWDVSGGYRLRLIDSYRTWQDAQTDGDDLGTTLDTFDRHSKFASNSQSHELQLISPKDKLLDGRLDFVGGLYYFSENYSIGNSIDFGPDWCRVVVPAAAQAICLRAPQTNVVGGHFNQYDQSYAGYLQADFKLTDTLTLTLGGRETHDSKTGAFNSYLNNPTAISLGAPEVETDLKTSTAKPTWRANLSWRPLNGIMTYVSYSTGYKSGGFNSSASSPALTTATRSFAPETSENYEIGVKAELLDHRLQLNADAYLMNIDDFQQRSFNGQYFVVRNAGDIRSEGVELGAQYRLNEHLRVELGGDYLYSYYTSNSQAPGLPGCSASVVNSCLGQETIVNGNPTIQNLTGRPNAVSPKWQGDLAVDYDTSPFAGGFVLQMRPDISFMDRFYATTDDNPQGVVKSHTLGDLRVDLISPSARWTLTGYVTNIADTHYWAMKYAQPLAASFGGSSAVTGQSLLRGYLGQPRVVGVKLTATF